MRARAIGLLKWALLLCLAGGGYALLIRWTGRGIPCPIHALTGLYCPGCGVSRFCMALLRLDFAAGFRSNAGLFILRPLGLAVLAGSAVRYLRTGERRPARWQSVSVWAMIAVLLAFGILRNLPAFAFLAPQ